VTVPANPASVSRPAGQHESSDRCTTASPTAVAVDLGSGAVGVWAAHRGTVDGSCGDAFASAGTLVRRGRVIDTQGCITLLSQLIRQYPEPVPAGSHPREAARHAAGG
jgi:rod shape-determining protein MreB